jgi:hypothetical protein
MAATAVIRSRSGAAQMLKFMSVIVPEYAQQLRAARGCKF